MNFGAIGSLGNGRGFGTGVMIPGVKHFVWVYYSWDGRYLGCDHFDERGILVPEEKE